MTDTFTSSRGPHVAKEQAHHAGETLDINAATVEQLMRLPGIDGEKARRLCEQRPFDGWEDLERLEGFGPEVVQGLKAGRAEIRRL